MDHAHADHPRLFLSYSRKDAKYRSELTTHLAVLARDHDIYAWTDETIRGGEFWRKAIDQGLAYAEIVILLVSANALTSKFILDNEVAKAIRAKKVIYPILVKDCAWDEVPWLEARMMRPRVGPSLSLKPLNKLRPADRDGVLSDITREISGLLKGAAAGAKPKRQKVNS